MRKNKKIKSDSKPSDRRLGVFAIRSKHTKARSSFLFNQKVFDANPHIDAHKVADAISKENKVTDGLTDLIITESETVPASPMNTPRKSDAVRDTPVKAEAVLKSPGGSQHKIVLPNIHRVGGIGYLCMEEEPDAEKANSKNKLINKRISKEKYHEWLEEFKKSSAFQAIKEIKQKSKEQNIDITKDSITKAKRKSSRKQGPILAREGVDPKEASATNYMAAVWESTTPIKAEWLHLVCYAVMGEDAQIIDNLIAGTYEANTQMIPFEVQLKKLASIYPQGKIQLHIKAELLPGTHIATNISYSIITPDFTLPLTFDPFSTQQPPAKLWDVADVIVKLFVDAAKATVTPIPATSTTSTTSLSAPTIFNPNKRYAEEPPPNPGVSKKSNK